MLFRKPLFILSLIACMFLSSSAFALTWGAFEYEFADSENTTIKITGYTGAGGAVVIPDNITGIPVVRIGGGTFYNKTTLTRVTIPDSVTSIGNYAFYNCTGLTGAFFYGNAPTMGTQVFDNCAGGFTVFYLAASTGFTSPTWYGYFAAEFDPYTTTTSSVGSTTTTTSPAGTGIIVGMITDADTGRTISGALITTSGGISDISSDGFYLMLHPAGVFTLSVTAVGYLTRILSCTVTSGEALTLNIALLSPGGTTTTTTISTIPVAVSDSYTTKKNKAFTVALPGVLENDTDAEGDSLTAILVTEPSNGELNLYDDGAFTYTPNKDFTGQDSFTYKASDGIDESAPTTVTITVGRQCPAARVLGTDNPRLAVLRFFRDNTLAKNAIGCKIIQIYYNHAESINAALERNPALMAYTKRVLEAIAPMVGNKD